MNPAIRPELSMIFREGSPEVMSITHFVPGRASPNENEIFPSHSSLNPESLTTSPLVMIVVVGYRSRRFLPTCLPAALSQEDTRCEILFVDNASGDESVSYVREAFPDVRIIEQTKNVGFPAACNVGIAEARRLGSKFVFLLNPDVVLSPTCLKTLLEAASTHIGLLQPLLHLPDGSLQSVGNRVHYLGFGCSGLYNPAGAGNFPFRIDYPSGAAVLIDVSIIERIGGLEESYFLYHEDLEYGLRARLAGFESWCVPTARAIHDHKYDRNPNKLYYMERNRYALLLAYARPATLLRLFPLLLAAEIAVWIYSFLQEPRSLRGKMAAMADLMSMGRAIRRLRTRVKKLQPDPFVYLFPHFAREIDFPPDAGAFPCFMNACSRLIFSGLHSWGGIK
ncbi:MAG: glycosyltransferase family 2 protein [Candidatus Ozemobacteraceae bacterium]